MQMKPDPAEVASRLRWLAIVFVVLLLLDGFFLVTALQGNTAPVPFNRDVPSPIPFLYSPYVYLDTTHVTNWVAQNNNNTYYIAVGTDDSLHAITLTLSDLDRVRADLAAQTPIRLYGTVSRVDDYSLSLMGQALGISAAQVKERLGTLCLNAYFDPASSAWQTLGFTLFVTVIVAGFWVVTYKKKKA